MKQTYKLKQKKEHSKFLTMKKKQFFALSLCFSFLLAVLQPYSSFATEQVYFTAANDSLLPLDAATMPVWVDGQIYVPYHAFDYSTSGINIGTHATYHASGGTVTVYNLGNTLTFNTNTGECYDQRSKVNYPYKVVYRRGVPFLPVAGVCNFFNLGYSYQKTDYGYLLRLKGKDTVLSDDRFIDAASSMLYSMLQTYKGTLETPTPAPTVLPTPQVETPLEEEVEEEELVVTPFLLGVDVLDYNVALWDSLGERESKAIFFFNLEQLESQGNLLRQLLGLGHSIGLKVSGDSIEEIEEEILSCNALLAQQARTSSSIISTNSSWHKALEEKGYILWKGTDSTSIQSANSLVNGLTIGSVMEYITLEQTELTLRNWNAFLHLATEKGFILQVPSEDKL